MTKFIKPKNLNGHELRDQLRAAGIPISNDPLSIVVEGDDSLTLLIDEKFEKQAADIVANHDGTIIAPEMTPAEKLAKAGLSIADLKALLNIE